MDHFSLTQTHCYYIVNLFDLPLSNSTVHVIEILNNHVSYALYDLNPQKT